MIQSDKSVLEQERRLVKAARVAVTRREEEIDGETLSRLRRARADALKQSKTRSISGYHWLWLSGACTVLVVALLWSGTDNSPGKIEPFIAGDWLLYEEVDVEMIEDMEFYQWLAEELDGHSS
ncbi:hypothetical protein P3339_16375 [Microbulbifer sp. MLAF003]|uniref:hypothetical protein n=1 Tax=Microbulbifer sp. MLAF003 TaxID=3032582 RepID=UPI0024AC8990|nr:hypothetical protein [Microbulbifer sp. MLAF003]WHI50015.1 hypothetical protein P3339_16375 [Microbulbifer sp. MLAF003]